jgi:hypothetical protein
VFLDPTVGRWFSQPGSGRVQVGPRPATTTPPWAVSAPPPPNPTLTPTQQAAWAAGFQQPTDTTSGTSPWGGYDIENDPGVIQARQQEQLGLQQLDAEEAKARREAIIRFGDPALASMAGFGLDPQDAAFAKQNYLSGNAELARIDAAHKDRRNSIVNQLAAHGILGSGELGYQQGREDLTYGQTTYDARNRVLDYLNQTNQSYLDRRNSLRQATLQALQNAYQFGLQNPQLYGGEDGGGAPGPSSGPSNASQIGTLERANTVSGYSSSDIARAAAAYAAPRSYGGGGYQPHMVMQEGSITYRNGVPGVMVKYLTGGGSTTEWTPLQ